MRRRSWVLIGAAVLVAATGGAIGLSGGGRSTAAATAPAADTVRVERGTLSATVTQTGTLTYRAQSDGSPYRVVNGAVGVFTRLPETGDEVACGGVLYRVDERPVVLLCGTIPTYRALRVGVRGRDVRQLNRNLHRLGYDAGARVRIDPGDGTFSSKTERALRVLQRKKGVRATGMLATADAVFLPAAVRVAEVSGLVGGAARPGAPVLSATSDVLQVQVDLDPSQRDGVERGDRATVTLPGDEPVRGRVAGFGRVAQAREEPGGQPVGATVPTFIRLDDPAEARGLDRAPVDVDIVTEGVDDALSVPVTALVGRSGGGFAVEVARGGERRELVAVRLGLFDTGGGRVQVVEGALRAGDRVVVPSI